MYQSAEIVNSFYIYRKFALKKMKKIIRLTESDLFNVVKECCKKIVSINEYLEKDYGSPLYNTLKKYYKDVEIVHDIWLLHLTKSPVEIMTYGFSNGLSKDYMLNNPLSLDVSGFGEHEDKGYTGRRASLCFV